MAIFQVFSRLQLPQPQVAPAATQHPQPAEPGVPRQLRADQLGGADGDGQAAPGVLRGHPASGDLRAVDVKPSRTTGKFPKCGRYSSGILGGGRIWKKWICIEYEGKIFG